MTNKEVIMTKDGGFYYRTVAFHYAFLAVFLIPVLIVVALAVLNPLWFREDFMRWVEQRATRLALWRDRIKYRIYLGTDPDMWHALKDK